MCFSDLRQLLDLFVSWDWSTYLADYGQETSKYLRVQPQNALIILDKLKESEKKNVFAIMNKKDKDKKRLVDTVYKQLKLMLKWLFIYIRPLRTEFQRDSLKNRKVPKISPKGTPQKKNSHILNFFKVV